ncbi:nucleoside-diphosphate-sugar epimerase [Tumebacillus sp. BK434]|uniref:NAD-dependent epimerase/dehydratase family protein n=1 Tax=Tumebacillus sp. BK434 TaxID=2512169 RepID=UPI00104CFA8D|nr:NAD-dependent epimerase/dehydratase family protein [Tumebacillus sp. BK434]TCP58304.1 nucleoside-diphosphate-sugar epimerase [Tumebacillus sp. BK434]
MKTALVFGGTKFFGKHLVKGLLADGVDVTIATRGQTPDEYGDRVQRLIVDRENKQSILDAVGDRSYDVVFDNICYSSNDAQAAVEVFAGKVGRYVFTSTLSVYDLSETAHDEADFNARELEIKWGYKDVFTYQEGKQQAEAVFFQQAPFPVVAVRFPVVMGTDDYTKRLHWHVDRVKAGLPIGMPNPESRQGFIHSAEAGQFLRWAATADITGEVNAAASGTVTLREMIGMIEQATGQQAKIVAEFEKEERSPFGPPGSYFMSLQKAEAAGYEFTKLHDWLPKLIAELV